MSEATDLKLEIVKLHQELDDVKFKLKLSEGKLQGEKEKYDNLVTVTTEQKHDDLTDIYKPNLKDNTIGALAVIGVLLSFVPKVQTLLSGIGLSSFVITILSGIIILLWCVVWLRNKIANEYILSKINAILNSKKLMQELNVVVPKESYRDAYFSENDVIWVVDSFMNKKLIKILFFGKYNQVKRQLVEYIILALEQKHLIIKSDVNDLTRLFYIKHTKIVSPY